MDEALPATLPCAVRTFLQRGLSTLAPAAVWLASRRRLSGVDAHPTLRTVVGGWVHTRTTGIDRDIERHADVSSASLAAYRVDHHCLVVRARGCRRCPGFGARRPVARAAARHRRHLGVAARRSGSTAPPRRSTSSPRDDIRRSGRDHAARGAAPRAQPAGGARRRQPVRDQRARLQQRARQQAAGADRRPHRLHAAVLRRVLGRAGRDARGHRAHRGHQRPGRNAVGRQRRQRRHQRHHAAGGADRRAALVAAHAGSRSRAAPRCATAATAAGRGHFRVYAKALRPLEQRAAPTAQPVGDAADGTQVGFRADWGRDATRVTLQGDAYRGSIDQLPRASARSPGRNLLGALERATRATTRRRRCRPTSTAPSASSCRSSTRSSTPSTSSAARLPRRLAATSCCGRRLPADRATASDRAHRWRFLPADRSAELVASCSCRTRSRCAGARADPGGAASSATVHRPSCRACAWPGSRGNGTCVWGALSRAVRAPSRIDREFFVPGAAAVPARRRAELPVRDRERARARLSRAAGAAVSLLGRRCSTTSTALRSAEPTPARLAVRERHRRHQRTASKAGGAGSVTPRWRLTAGCVSLRQRLRRWRRAQSTPAAAPRSATTRAIGGRCARRSTSRRAGGRSRRAPRRRAAGPRCPPTPRSTRAWRWRVDARHSSCRCCARTCSTRGMPNGASRRTGSRFARAFVAAAELAGSMSRARARARALLALALAAGSAPRALRAARRRRTPPLEASVKAAFLYKFAGYVDWPPRGLRRRRRADRDRRRRRRACAGAGAVGRRAARCRAGRSRCAGRRGRLARRRARAVRRPAAGAGPQRVAAAGCAAGRCSSSRDRPTALDRGQRDQLRARGRPRALRGVAAGGRARGLQAQLAPARRRANGWSRATVTTLSLKRGIRCAAADAGRCWSTTARGAAAQRRRAAGLRAARVPQRRGSTT